MALLDRWASERRRGNLWRCQAFEEWRSHRSLSPSSLRRDRRSCRNASATTTATGENPKGKKRVYWLNAMPEDSRSFGISSCRIPFPVQITPLNLGILFNKYVEKKKSIKIKCFCFWYQSKLNETKYLY